MRLTIGDRSAMPWAMSESQNKPVVSREETAAGTAAWVAVVIGFAVLAIIVLSILGPLGER